ncbi:DHHA1 domain-containing protein, partial [Martelella sp. UBA3392]
SGEKAGKTYSLELCGGTHVRATGDIGLIRIVGESAVGAGVRRIEALTGVDARRYLTNQDEKLKALAASLKVQPDDVGNRVETLLDERRRLERELTEARKQLALGGAGSADEAEKIGDINLIAKVLSGVAAKDLKGMADTAKTNRDHTAVAFIAVAEDGKASIVVSLTEDLTQKFSAVDLVRAASEAVGGKGGGGRPDMAQAGGPDGANAEAAINAVRAALAG